jgi:hypothetical protein
MLKKTGGMYIGALPGFCGGKRRDMVKYHGHSERKYST